MEDITKRALELLRHSGNENTREHAIDILEDRLIPFAKGIPALEVAATGSLGGFLQAVVKGDVVRMWQMADSYNRVLIDPIVPNEIKERY